MRMIIACFAVAYASLAVAADPPIEFAYGSQAEAAAPAYPKAPCPPCDGNHCSKATPQTSSKPKPTLEQQMRHLEKAIDHLRDAGFPSEAEYVGLLSLKQLAKQKKAELEMLEREIKSVEHCTEAKAPAQVKEARQVIGHFKVIEIDRAKFAKEIMPLESDATLASSLLFDTAHVKTGDEGMCLAVEGVNAPRHILQNLLDKGVAKVLAEPTLVTVDRRPACLHVGGELPIPIPQRDGKTSVDFKKFGTQVDWVPVMQKDGTVRMEVRLRVTEVDHRHTTKVDGIEMPSLNTREVDAGIELKPGQTAILGGLIHKRSAPRGNTVADAKAPASPLNGDKAVDTELLFFVRPELGDTLQAQKPTEGPAKR